MGSRRNTELFLLIAAMFPVTLLYALYVINTGTQLSFQTLAVPIGLFAAFAAAHIAVRIWAPGADPAILPVVFVLSGVGITFVTRLKPEYAMGQLVCLFGGILLMVLTLALVRNIDVVRRYKYTLGVVGVILLLLPMFIGREIYGSKLWIVIGSFSIQPGEFAKICIVLFLAGYLAENRELLAISNRKVLGFSIPRLRLLAPLFVVWGLCLLVVVFERDLGSALLFYTIFLMMLYVATGRLSYVIIGVLLLAVGGLGAYRAMAHVRVRFDVWLHPFADPSNKGLQIVQSLFSIADGGLVGSGIGKGMPTLIPVVESDFIFSAIGEEMGLLGGSAVLLLFMLLAVRGLTTAARAKSDLAAFAAVGLTASLSFQAFLIVGGVTRLIPLTGVTLPFMSQGGSSLLSSFVVVALLLRAGDEGTGRDVDLASVTGGAGAVPLPVGAASAETSEVDGEGEEVPYRPGRGYSSAVRGQSSSRLRGGAHLRRRALDTPESGVLGRVALAKRLTRTVVAFSALFAVLIGNLTYIQVVRAADYQEMPINNHTIRRAAYIQRGSIITADNVTLAQSEKQADGTYKRTYPQGTLAANTVGYYSQRYGSAGVENRMDTTLTGSKDYSTWEDAVNSLAGVTQPGNSVVLTIDSRIQRAAEQALSGLSGAVVVLEPSTGKVLARVSSPTYDPNDIDSAVAKGDSGGALFDRTTQALYTPGSTFKAVTLSAALDKGTAKLTSTYSAPASIQIGGKPITNIHNQGFGTITVDKAFAYSANTAFAQVAVQVGAGTLVDYAKAFGYGQKLGQDFDTAASIMADPSQMTEWETGWAGAGQPVGQGHTPGPQTTAMQNAVVAAAIANKGIAMYPYVVDHTLSPDGVAGKSTAPKAIGQSVSAGSAAQVKQAMLDVVEHGSGSKAAVNGVKVAGKTGTAQATATDVNSLFIGFAPYDQPTLAISVVVEKTQDNNVTGAEVASKVLSAALAIQGAQ